MHPRTPSSRRSRGSKASDALTDRDDAPAHAAVRAARALLRRGAGREARSLVARNCERMRMQERVDGAAPLPIDGIAGELEEGRTRSFASPRLAFAYDHVALAAPDPGGC